MCLMKSYIMMFNNTAIPLFAQIDENCRGKFDYLEKKMVSMRGRAGDNEDRSCNIILGQS